MPDKPDFFYLKTGMKRSDLQKERPTAKDAIQRRLKQLKSKYPVRSIGRGTDGELFLTEEERESHLHILGTTGEGKSRFIEHLIRGDIKQGNGVCFLDPSDRANTAYRILRYCASIGFDKVCLIDPYRRPLACIQPFTKYKASTVANIDSTIRTVFQTKDQAETTRLNRYLPALLRVLWEAKMTLHESLYFSNFENLYYKAKRTDILNRLHPFDRDRITIEGVFKSYSRFETYFSSTVNRLDPFWDSTLSLMFGADKGIDFRKMITEGWVILVNLYSGLGFEPLQSRVLGTSIINEVIAALDSLWLNHWKGVYYLYVDEAGRYANRNLAELLAHKRQSGLRVAIAHQYFKQFEDPYVLEAIKNLCKLKVMFNTPNHNDRLDMIKALGYGGDIPPLMASYANANLPKQYAVVAVSKQPPVRVKIPNVPDAIVSRAAEADFIQKCLSHEWNFTPKEIREQMNDRTQAIHPASPHARTVSNRKTTSDTPKTRRKSLLDIKD